MIIFCRILLYFTFLNTIWAKECRRICGIATPPKRPRDQFGDPLPPKTCKDDWKQQKLQRPPPLPSRLLTGEDEIDPRIVNGYNAPDRGFMVLLRANNPEDPEGYETCGGALINNRYILTAGHCVCINSAMSNVQCENGRLKYDPQKILKAYVGVNDNDITHLNQGYLRRREDKESIKPQVHSIEKVILHPSWDGSGTKFPDLALLKLKKKVRFVSRSKDKKYGLDQKFKRVVPICLPRRSVKNSNNNHWTFTKDVFVSGWGRLRNEDCFTNNDGPNRHARCRFPFYYKGKLEDSCMMNPSPSSGNRRCQQFKADKGISKMPQPGESFKIIYARGKRSTICYHENPTQNGWCGVCIKEAKDWTSYGYCPPGGPPPLDRDQITRVRKAMHWGFCSDLCNKNIETNVLQETSLCVLSDNDCAHFNTSTLVFDESKELCAANKIAYPMMQIYVRKKLRKQDQNGKRKYVFIHKGEKKNTFNAKENQAKLDYYLGHTDSCQGDSGGPLYRFRNWSYVDPRTGKKITKNQAFLVGVVSRGDDCAGFNQPGIYTDIFKERQWILENSKDGSCQ